VIDFHCHLDLFPDPKVVVTECVRRNLKVLSVTTTPSAWKGTSVLVSDVSQIHTALGLHPQLAQERYKELQLFDGLLAGTRYVGEVGLDGALEFRAGWPAQIRVFEHILQCCRDSGGRIMSIHSRRASGAVLDCLERYPEAGTPVLHWFSGSLRDLDRATRLGCWFSVGSAMLASEKGRALVARMPHDRVLTESDGPFAQLNGQALMPWQVDDALMGLESIWSLPPGKVAGIVDSNLKALATKRPNGADGQE
jgi:TatD DNase family protein